MLQQTQVSRVVERFAAFVARFPTVQSLAEADEHDVLAMWSGLGYYRRARNLHAAAKMIVERFGGEVPRDVESLRTLPGVGRYTAGAIASIVFGERVPLVDANVVRVVLRIDGGSDGDDADAYAWRRATELVAASGDPGVFNEGMMELGALVCTGGAGKPLCESCSVSRWCVAKREGTQAAFPPEKIKASRKRVFVSVVVVERADGCVLLEQRGAGGMWAGLWQPPSVERMDRFATRDEVAAHAGLGCEVQLSRATRLVHQTTHREVVFSVRRARVDSSADGGRERRWVSREALDGFGLASPHARMLSG
jgi:A/G-specific adenine glycosylase